MLIVLSMRLYPVTVNWLMSVTPGVKVNVTGFVVPGPVKGCDCRSTSAGWAESSPPYTPILCIPLQPVQEVVNGAAVPVAKSRRKKFPLAESATQKLLTVRDGPGFASSGSRVKACSVDTG